MTSDWDRRLNNLLDDLENSASSRPGGSNGRPITTSKNGSGYTTISNTVPEKADHVLKNLNTALAASTNYIETHRTIAGPDGSRQEFHEYRRYEDGVPKTSKTPEFDLEKSVQHMMPSSSQKMTKKIQNTTYSTSIESERPGSRLKQNIDELDTLLYDLNHVRKISDSGDYSGTPGNISSDDYSSYPEVKKTYSSDGAKPPSPSPRRRITPGLSSPSSVRNATSSRTMTTSTSYRSEDGYKKSIQSSITPLIESEPPRFPNNLTEDVRSPIQQPNNPFLEDELKEQPLKSTVYDHSSSYNSGVRQPYDYKSSETPKHREFLSTTTSYEYKSSSENGQRIPPSNTYEYKTPEHGHRQTPTNTYEYKTPEHGHRQTPTNTYEYKTPEHEHRQTPTNTYEYKTLEHGSRQIPTNTYDYKTPEHGYRQTPTNTYDYKTPEHGHRQIPTNTYDYKTPEHGHRQTPTNTYEYKTPEHGSKQLSTTTYDYKSSESESRIPPSQEYKPATPGLRSGDDSSPYRNSPVPLKDGTPTGVSYYTKYHSTHSHRSQHLGSPKAFPNSGRNTPLTTYSPSPIQQTPKKVDELMTELSEFDPSISNEKFIEPNPPNKTVHTSYRMDDPEGDVIDSQRSIGLNEPKYPSTSPVTVTHTTSLRKRGAKGKGEGFEKGKFSDSSSKQGAAVVPVCLPLCCAAPCVIL